MEKEEKITESAGEERPLDLLPLKTLLRLINEEDKTVPMAVEEALPQIEALAEAYFQALLRGCRVFYIGAGTSGRLGIVDASELPPTYGVPQDWVVGLIAGGDGAIRKAVEFAEDSPTQAWEDLKARDVRPGDVVIGIAASGSTPYVVGGLQAARQHGCITGCITCNPGAPVTQHSDFPVVVVVGPEIVAGSTRMKAGTAQKLVLNMLSTTAMIRLGRVQGNWMVDMQLSNTKLIDRGTRMIMRFFKVGEERAREALLKAGSVREVISHPEVYGLTENSRRPAS
ncbi:MAG: N-acetylmuramic acid 6-phosphate etherase [Flavobacteriales bacterium]|nr:N-acetylmuramic acid 6-phosphate etherase [Flavobacteriales bacterium]MCX7648978.1 N-acetylmuramic acid 6-phosphate etherase [Flavobacteriales bacterium]MDW8431856.1 N-acetylmuramic acid 6-phosphate etherase [Flavobacteriales bacterium]